MKDISSSAKDIIQKIQNYNNDIKSSQAKPYKEPCVKCGQTPDDGFKRHDSWRRSFRCVTKTIVTIFFCDLVRWKCPLCSKTFTILPSFAAPYKRYVTEPIVGKSEAYLNDSKLSTRKAVLYDDMPIGYQNTPEDQIDERQVSHSTIWRWTEWLRSQKDLLDEALSLIRQKDPLNTFHRENVPISPVKYRSEKRKQTLESASLFIRAHHFFERVFLRSLFPRFATAPG